MSDDTVSWFAAVDWGSEQHQACILDAAGKIAGERAFPHSDAGLAALCDWLVSVARDPNAVAVAVAIEVPHGPVVDALLDRGLAVHAINPKQLDRLRDRFSVAGAKDDRRDARVAAAGLRTDPHLFRPVQAGDPAIIALREWSRLAEELQQERVRLGNPRKSLAILLHPSAALALLPAAARGERRHHGRVGAGAVNHRADPGQGGAPARDNAGAAAQTAPYPQDRCRNSARHATCARHQGGRRRHRGRRPASAVPHGPATPVELRVPPGRAQAW